MKRGLILVIALIFTSYFVHAGSCDISTWRVTNDDGSVASVVATIDGVTYDFVTRQYDSGVERVFYRTSSKSGGATPISQSDAVTLVDLFLYNNLNKIGLQGYGNVKYDSISDGNYIIKADDYIKENPDNCEGINYITGIIYIGIDPDANIVFINPKIALYTGLSSTQPSLIVPAGAFTGIVGPARFTTFSTACLPSITIAITGCELIKSSSQPTTTLPTSAGTSVPNSFLTSLPYFLYVSIVLPPILSTVEVLSVA